MVFNMEVNNILHHWITVVEEAGGEAGPEGLGQETQQMLAYFYANYGLLTSMQVTRLQRVFNSLADIFDRVILRKIMGKMVSITCHLCSAIGGHSTEVYGLWITVEVLTHR